MIMSSQLISYVSIDILSRLPYINMIDVYDIKSEIDT